MPALEEEPVRNKTSRPAKADVLVDPGEHPIEEKKTPFFRRRRLVIGVAIVLILAVAYVATLFFHNLTHESTDDAFIDAHIMSIAPKIAGKISAVKVRNNEFVKKGQVLLEIDPRDVEAMVAQKRAALEVAQAHLENAKMSAEQAKAHVQTLLAVYASAQAEHSGGGCGCRRRCRATSRGTRI